MANARGRPWRMLLPLIAVLAIAVIWSIYWFAALNIAQEFFRDERQRLAARGVTLNCSSESWGGYPFRFEFSCPSPVLTLPQAHELRSANLLAVALAYRPSQVVLLLDGPTGASGQSIQPVSLNHQRIVASVTSSGDNDVSVSVEIPQIAVPGLLRAGRLLVHTRPSAPGAMDVAMFLEQFVYQPQDSPGLTIDGASLRGSISPSRQLNVDRIELNSSTIRYWGNGLIELDALRRLSGRLATETNDLDGLLGILEPHLRMTQQQKDNIRMVLGLLGSSAKADLVARDGELFLGPVKITDLPPLY